MTGSPRTNSSRPRSASCSLGTAPPRFWSEPWPSSCSPERCDPAWPGSRTWWRRSLRRHGSAEIGNLRFAREPVELAGATIARGDLVLVVLASGNRDRRRFTDPDAIDPARPDKAHLTFGHGMHYCLGAALARTMAEVALAALFRAAPRLTLHRDVFLQTTD
ncbi:cytochrome P450, partial [Streptomyces drozdowiczii]